MAKEGESLEERITNVAEKFLEESKDKEIYVVSHFDTDGISSAAIMSRALQEMDKQFSVKIVKSLEEEFIKNLPRDKLILFLDLASGSLDYIKKYEFEKVFIIDHHEITQEVPENVEIINTELHQKQKISGSGLTYLFCKELNPSNKKLAKLAILGMVGDCLEKEIGSLNHGILEDSEIKRKKGLLLYPATRPLNRVLEYSSNPYIPEVTGNIKEVLELLRSAGLAPVNGKYKSILELDENEMEKLTTSILLRNPKAKNEEIVGEIFLLKHFNKMEDAREISAKINACSRFGKSETALQYCMEIPSAKKKVESIHVKYKQELVSGIKFVQESPKIEGRGFAIINAKNNVKDTMIGTIASILSNSHVYEEGTIITTMAHYDDKIKVSARSVGRKGRNIREILSNVTNQFEGEVGGHEFAAGCIISQDNENEFIDSLKKQLELEVIKV